LAADIAGSPCTLFNWLAQIIAQRIYFVSMILSRDSNLESNSDEKTLKGVSLESRADPLKACEPRSGLEHLKPSGGGSHLVLRSCGGIGRRNSLGNYHSREYAGSNPVRSMCYI
jgi:hypothetical protein